MQHTILNIDNTLKQSAYLQRVREAWFKHAMAFAPWFITCVDFNNGLLIMRVEMCN